MALNPGVRLGAYEIVSPLGAGGMGEVYRARDTKLQRDVAVKILPDSFALDPDRIARFTREAQLLAALNHRHIAAIHGFEEANGAHFLVLELVEGETLAQRLRNRSGPLPIGEALGFARQIADALQAAHDKGIIHRDLKPANVALTSDDQVKVLDFGLAKYDAGKAGWAGESGADVANSPTLTFAATQAGMILGTAAYMSPEQAKGRTTDKRSDIWAFGCVLFEMLTGKRAFEGDDASDTLASVLKGDPDWRALPAGVPASIRTLIQRCLEKDRQQRIADIAVARFVLDEPVSATGPQLPGALPASPSSRRWRTATAFGAVALGAAILGGLFVRFTTPRSAPSVTRLSIASSTATTPIVSGGDRDLAIAPDGSRIVYVGGNGAQFLVRALDQLEPVPLTGLGAPSGPFFSPDGQWIGFFNTNASLRKVAVTGGPPVTLCDLNGAVPRGGTWAEDGTIVFATSGASGLVKVPSTGGTPAVVTTPNREQGEGDHLWPEFLPGGRAVLFTITSATGALDSSQVAVVDLQTGQQKTLVRGGSHAHYLANGHLVYNTAGTLRAVPFDLDRLEVAVAPAVPVLAQVSTTTAGGGNFDVAQNGTLAYISGGIQTVSRTLVWVDRQGREEPLKAPARAYLYPRLSPDGTRVALDIRDQQNDIWLWSLERETLTRLTADAALDRFPLWMPDGRIVFSSDRAGAARLFRQAADGTGAPERLTTGSGDNQFAMSVSPEGKQIVLRADAGGGAPGRDLLMLTLEDRRVQPFIKTPFLEQNGMISPDGRWLAYESNDTGQFEIYVRPFPNVNGGHWQVSTAGGIQPLWARNAQELFYLSPEGATMSVAVGRGPGWSVGPPSKIIESSRYFHGSGWPANAAAPTYDVSMDGKRFLVIKSGSVDQTAGTASLIVVQNWFQEIARLAPRTK